jgi:hypothetical protein
MKKTIASVGLALLMSAYALPALACQGDKELFVDDFSFHDLAWGDASERFFIKDGKATISAKPDNVWWSWDLALTYTDADICLTVKPTAAKDPAVTKGGLMFWVEDNDNFFIYAASADGHYYVGHFVAGKWAPTIVPWTASDAIKQGVGVANDLRVTIKGNVVTLWANGKQIGKFRGKVPEKPSYIGLYADSGPLQPDVWEFTNLKVTNVK